MKIWVAILIAHWIGYAAGESDNFVWAGFAGAATMLTVLYLALKGLGVAP